MPLGICQWLRTGHGRAGSMLSQGGSSVAVSCLRIMHCCLPRLQKRLAWRQERKMRTVVLCQRLQIDRLMTFFSVAWPANLYLLKIKFFGLDA